MVLAQSGSSNVAVKNELNTKCCESSSNTKIQNIAKACSVQEQGDGFSNDRKQVKDNFGYAAGDGFPNDGKPTKDRSYIMQQVRLLLWVSPPSFWVPVLVPGFSWFLPVPGSLCFVFACGCCSESEDSLNLLRIQHSNSLCEYVSFFFLELRVHHCALHSVHNSLLLHLANRASFTCKTDSFFVGPWPRRSCL